MSQPASAGTLSGVGASEAGDGDQSGHTRIVSGDEPREFLRYPFSDTEESTDDLVTGELGVSRDEEESPRLRPTDDADDSEGVAEYSLAEADGALRNQQAIKSGYLMKKGEKRRTWKRRWFVLRPTRFAYYQNDKEYELLKIIDLKDIHAIAEVELKKRKHVFGLVTRERTYYVQALSREDMEEWLRVLRTAQRQAHADASRAPSSSGTRNDGLTVQTGSSHTGPSQNSTAPSSPVRPATRTSTTNGPSPRPDVTADSSSQASHQDSVGTADSFLTVTTTPSSIFSAYAISATDSTPSSVIPYVPSAPTQIDAPSRAVARMRFSGSPPLDAVPAAHAQRSPTAEYTPVEATSIASTPSNWRPELSSSDDDADEEGEASVDGSANDDRVVMQGYLEKRVTNNYKKLATQKGWKKRWFVLRNGRLFGYKNDGEYVVKRLIPLRSVLDVLEIDPQGKNHLFCFKVVLPKRQMVLCAGSEEDMKRWIEALRSVHQAVRKPSDSRMSP
ncbi:uncharacterized protein SPPG_07250 [Spizellomyces punctatus DAOM BR117]|uniref:PH domain-containing protein n=1 Tax=Spizellomyces punctatus (strain DAOM BR117) TaxID=645134 RepID=A0A0L0H8L6_SPIPD|nr:uncharacterized protein SPPG_07250 [Spizellomyces punctatus DAOM BR117]KNC97321.1 hypothetical protein SPPG_07250 [Spizellomyces punctatus DAOM BR117]|eukprot:XP_016605361.1 hypothetical protein SPPG_07250 [Spizellomyces punctatus DAOM BR117]